MSGGGEIRQQLLADDRSETPASGEISSLEQRIAEKTWKDDLGWVFNMALCILGPGVLTIPYALAQSGWVLGLLIFIAGAWMNIYTVHALIDIVPLLPPHLQRFHSKTFEDIATYTYGKGACYFLQANLLVMLTGFICGNLITIAQLSHVVLKQFGHGDVSKEVTLIVLLSCVILPLCMIRDLSILGKYASPLGIMSLIGLCFVVCFQYFMSLGHHAHHTKENTPELFIIGSSTLLTFPIATFSFTVQTYMFPLFQEIQEDVKPSKTSTEGAAESDAESSMLDTSILDEDALAASISPASRARFKRISNMAMVLSFMIYMSVGMFGVLQFGPSTLDIILLNYNAKGQTSHLTVAISGVMAGTVMICLPLNVYPLRCLIDEVCFPGRPFSYKRFIPETLAIIAVAFTIAVTVENIGKIFDVTGATGCMFVSYLFPCLFVSKVLRRWGVLMGVVCVVGTAFSVVSLWKIVPELYTKTPHSNSHEQLTTWTFDLQ